jgi:hypothetical protein
MEYFNYITDNVYYVLENIKDKTNEILFPEPEFKINLNLEGMTTSDTIILLNKLKTTGKPVKLVIDENDKLAMLKISLNLCLESPLDTTTIMLKQVQKYKGEKYKSSVTKQTEYLDKDIEQLEERYRKLVEEIRDEIENNEDTDTDEDGQNNDGAIKIVKKKKVSIPC